MNNHFTCRISGQLDIQPDIQRNPVIKDLVTPDVKPKCVKKGPLTIKDMFAKQATKRKAEGDDNGPEKKKVKVMPREVYKGSYFQLNKVSLFMVKKIKLNSLRIRNKEIIE